jgi:hypothetical protein
MKLIFSSTFAACVLGAAIGSSQTPSTQSGTKPPVGQTQSGEQTQGGGAQSDAQKQTPGQRAHSTSTTYHGYLRGSAAGGYTISPISNRPGSVGTAGSATAGGGASTHGAATYTVMAPAGSTADLAAMADQCVEIVGVLGPETGTSGSTSGERSVAGPTTTSGNADAVDAGRSTSGNTAAGTTAAGNMAGGNSPHHRTLTVTTIRAMQGGCTQ